MKIVLTGSNGFLGKHVLSELSSSGHQVTCLVHGRPGEENEIHCDLNDVKTYELVDLLSPVDCIIHLAAKVDFSRKLNPSLFKVNCTGTFRLIQLAKELDCHFIYASSALVAGSSLNQIGKDTPANPETNYHLSKFISERAVEDFLENHTILRIGGIYGLRGPSHLYLNLAIMNALDSGTPPNILGTGSSKRNYLFVKDLASWIGVIAETGDCGLKIMGGPEILSVNSIMHLVTSKFIGAASEPSFSDRENASQDQVIRSDPAPIGLSTYNEAFDDIVKNYKRASS